MQVTQVTESGERREGEEREGSRKREEREWGERERKLGKDLPSAPLSILLISNILFDYLSLFWGAAFSDYSSICPSRGNLSICKMTPLKLLIFVLHILKKLQALRVSTLHSL